LKSTEARTVITDQHMAMLSKLLFQGCADDFHIPATDAEAFKLELAYAASLTQPEWNAFVQAANTHHVVVRGLQVLERVAFSHDEIVRDLCRSELEREQRRINLALDSLAPICAGLEAGGCPVTVIKSLDHLPDLGSDLDLYTSADPDRVIHVMQHVFHAELEDRSWGDRLANKWNFKIPGLPELIEIHVRYLGQTGEHEEMARRVINRAVDRRVGRHVFSVPAPEERIIISSLQRMYRHFYFRLCDMADTAKLLKQESVDFHELRLAADTGGVWPGVATYLHLVAEYAKAFGLSVDLPDFVLEAVEDASTRVFLRSNFLRVPLWPSARLYGSQLLSAGAKRDYRAIRRLPLLPPLAVTALIASRLTGTDKGIW
jgi:hypothetical protein